MDRREGSLVGAGLPHPLEVSLEHFPEVKGRLVDLTTHEMQIWGIDAKVGDSKALLVSSNGGSGQVFRLLVECTWTANGNSTAQHCSRFKVRPESAEDFSHMFRIAQDEKGSGEVKAREMGFSQALQAPNEKSFQATGDPIYQSSADSVHGIDRILKDFLSFRRTALYLLVIWDIFAIAVSVWGGYSMMPGKHAADSFHVSLLETYSLMIVFFPVVALLFGMYERETLTFLPSLLIYCASAAMCLWSAALGTIYLVSVVLPGRWISGTGFLLLSALMISGRLLYRSIITWRPIRVVFLGEQKDRDVLSEIIAGRKFKDLLILDCDRHGSTGPGDWSAKTSARGSTMQNEGGFDWLVVSRQKCAEFREVITDSLKKGIRVDTVTTFIEENFHTTPGDLVDPQWLVEADKRLLWNMNRVVKRCLDQFVSIMAIAATFPVWILVAVSIKIQDGGPIFYRQQRVGRNGMHFEILKFRSMCDGAERLTGPKWACPNDARVTRFGRLLRKTRIDELPQFLNVIRGEMSLVGPRPERPEFVAELEKSIPNYSLRHLIRPGISGWAQIRYRYGSSLEDTKKKLSYDLYYIKHGTILLDLFVMLRTFAVLMRGAR